MKPKILLITNLCSPYRVGLFELLKRKYYVKFLFFSGGEEKYYDGPSLLGKFDGEYLKGFNILPKIKINPKLIYYLSFGDYTHVIKCINGPVPLTLSFFISKMRGKKFILWSSLWKHPDTFFHKLSFPLIRLLYKYSDAIVVYGTHVKNYLISLGVPSEKITIAWQVQDNSKFAIKAADDELAAIKKELGITTSKVILFVGRMVEQKGVNILLEAFKIINFNDVSLLFIGNGHLAKTIQSYDNGDKIFYLPKVEIERLYLYYALADIFVLPSITTNQFKETWGFVVNEAMCQGCAIITSDAVGAGVGGLVEKGKNGFVVPESNALALKEAIKALLNDEVLLNSMKKRSLEIIKDWTYKKMAKGFENAIELSSQKK